jgi:flagellin-like hook-associated protein FlgL
MADITLTAASRSNLMALQTTAAQVKKTQGRLSTGKAVASVVDDALKFFGAKSLSDRASDLNSRKDAIDQGISTLKTVTAATDKIESLVSQAKGVINSSRSSTKEQRKEFALQLNSLLSQIQKLVNDTTYAGQNLLNSTSSKLSVFFSDKVDSKLDVNGVDFNSSGALYKLSDGSGNLTVNASNLSDTSVIGTSQNAVLSIFGFVSGAGLAASMGNSLLVLSGYNLSDATILASYNEQANIAVARLDATINNVRAKASVFGSSVAILQVRLDFTKSYTNLLEEGSDKLTLADLNEEGANLLALQTRQQLGIQALSFAGQSEQGILGLFR